MQVLLFYFFFIRSIVSLLRQDAMIIEIQAYIHTQSKIYEIVRDCDVTMLANLNDNFGVIVLW